MHKILINGAWVDALSKTGREITNPATLKPLGTVPDCGGADVDRAVAAAKAAQHAWWKVPGVEKAKLLREIGARMAEREARVTAALQSAFAPVLETAASLSARNVRPPPWPRSTAAIPCWDSHALSTTSRHGCDVPASPLTKWRISCPVLAW